MSKGIDRLKKILPENQAVLSKTAKSGNIPNLSTQAVEETAPFDSRSFEGAFQAQAGMGSEHLDLAVAGVQGGVQQLSQIRNDLQPFANQLKGMRLPDTRVNIDGIKMECPHELKQFAIDLDQEKYQKVMFALLDSGRMKAFQDHATRANQNNTPAIWLNQAVWFETKKPYVFLISRNLSEQAEALKVPEESAKIAATYLQQALGDTLFQALHQIASVNQLSVYAVFILIVDEVLRSRTVTAAPVTATSLWEDPTGATA